MTDRDLMQQALDALRQCEFTTPPAQRQIVKNALAALRERLAQPETEPVIYAGIKIWIGNKQVVQKLTQTQLHHAIDPWLLVELTADKCIAALKEKVND
jgi:hypothetical protein